MGKLILGGCGAQLGMVSAFTVVTILFVACGVCAMANILSIGLAQQLFVQSAPATREASVAESEQVSLLVAQVETLLGQFESQESLVSVDSSSSVPAVLGQPMVQAG